MITLGEGLHYDVPMEIYHGNCCPGPSVSASVLEEMRDDQGCPAKALAKHYLSPWRDEDDDDDTEALSFGRAAHVYIVEGPEAFAERYTVKPEGHDGRTKEGRAWLVANTDKTIVGFKQHQKIVGMATGLAMNKGAIAALAGKPEVTAIAKDPETGIWLKARPDVLRDVDPRFGRLAVNYKTTKSAAGEPFMRQAWELGYFVGAALCIDVLTLLGEPSPKYAILAQEKTRPYLAKVRVLTDDYVVAGRMMYRRALRQFAECIAKNEWPGYGDDIGALPYPPWAERILANIESPL